LDAQYELGKRYDRGYEGLRPNQGEAEHWLKRAELSGHEGAKKYLANKERERKKEKKRLEDRQAGRSFGYVPGWYVGGGATLSGASFSGSHDYGDAASAAGYNIRLGYNYNPWLALELDWRGSNDFDISSSAPGIPEDISLTRGISVNMKWYFKDRFENSSRVQFYGLVGGGHFEFHERVIEFGEEHKRKVLLDDQEFGSMASNFGIGIDYVITPSLLFYAEVSAYAVGLDLAFIPASVGLLFRF